MGTTCQATSNLLCQRKYFSSCHEDWKKIRNRPSIGSSLKVAPFPFPRPCCPLLLPSFSPLFPQWNPTEQSMPWEDFSRLIFSALIYIYFYSRKIYHWVMQRYIKMWTLQIPEIQCCTVFLEGRNLLVKGRKVFAWSFSLQVSHFVCFIPTTPSLLQREKGLWTRVSLESLKRFLVKQGVKARRFQGDCVAKGKEGGDGR